MVTSGANGGSKIFIFPVQLTTNRTGNFLIQLVHYVLFSISEGNALHTVRRYFRNAHFIPIMGVGKRGAY